MTAAPAPLAEDAPLLDMSGVSVVAGGRPILDSLDLMIDAGEHVAILGANGSGKSTLVKLIARQLYPRAGATMRVFGRESWNVRELRGLLGIVSPAIQGDFTGNERLEAFEAVASGFFGARGLWRQAPTDAMRAASHEALARMGAAHLAGRDMASLSTGEARRVLIARALVHGPRALLLDEPCAGLDPATRRRFLETLRGLARDGTTILMVTHHIEEILPEIDRVVMLREGRLLRDGAKADLIDPATLGELFGAPMTVERRGGWFWARLD
jgi:iron complex transport system ATP-binding protein